MADIHEEMTNPWMAIDYLEAQLSAKDAEIARLLREIERV